MMYGNIISIKNSNVTLENVNFTNIVPYTEKFVIENYEGNYLDTFVYRGGLVELINNGYEIIEENPLGGFISLSNIENVEISGVSFSYNILNTDSAPLISLSKVYKLEMDSNLFKNNYNTDKLIKIMQSDL